MLQSYHPSVVRDVGKESQRDASDAAWLVRPWCLEPEPLII